MISNTWTLFLCAFALCFSISSLQKRTAEPEQLIGELEVSSLKNISRNTRSCHRREYTFRAVNSDLHGRKCWQYITIMSCWGRCDSGEYADWRFPYKKSFHPVCIHEQLVIRRIRLRHCDHGVDAQLRIYTYIEALSCACAPCQSSLASCESVAYGTTSAP